MRIANSSLAVILAAILEPLAAHAEDGSSTTDVIRKATSGVLMRQRASAAEARRLCCRR